MKIEFEIPDEKIKNFAISLLQNNIDYGNVIDVAKCFLDTNIEKIQIATSLIEVVKVKADTFFNVRISEKTRKREVNFARQLAMTVVLVYTELGLNTVAKRFNYKSHLTVANAITVIERDFTLYKNAREIIINFLKYINVAQIDSDEFESRLKKTKDKFKTIK